jgi:hypothetical protein
MYLHIKELETESQTYTYRGTGESYSQSDRNQTPLTPHNSPQYLHLPLRPDFRKQNNIYTPPLTASRTPIKARKFHSSP